MDLGIAIDFGRGGLEDLCADPLGESQHVDRTVDACLGGLHRIELVVNRACRTSEIVDLVDFYVEGKGDVVTDDFERPVVEQVRDVALDFL